jgi:hypothetical protein
MPAIGAGPFPFLRRIVSRAVFSGRGIVACRRVGPALFIG